MKKLILLLLIFISTSCKYENYPANISSKQYDLSILDSLTFNFYEIDEVIIPGQIEAWQDKILISEYNENFVYIFDEKLNYINKIAGNGRGPGEFIYFPNIMLQDSTFVLHSYGKADKYNSNFEIIGNYKLPAEINISYMMTRNIEVENKFIMSTITDPFHSFDKTSPFVVMDTSFIKISDFSKWDEIYLNKEYEAFNLQNFQTMIEKKDANEFFIKPQASHKIQHYKNWKLVKEFSYKPSFFKRIPKISIAETQKNMETFSRYVPKITFNRNLCYDDINQFLVVGYHHTPQKVSNSPRYEGNQYFITVFNMNFECVFEGKAPGTLEFAKNGYIYFNVFCEDKIKLVKCKLH